ncbi:hypothetical protein MUK42_33130 [Musa troglodytarum]|uniref:Uncharacterized protein n=1 Tax=Musa troglodytarum TaxID=320322 RepID=A0A9E7JV06_9LILI|nr:hypothetical protein MUK42_33130 [Musa troglodytarum]
MWAMSDEKPPAEICKGVNGDGNVVLREDNRRSAEVMKGDFFIRSDAKIFLGLNIKLMFLWSGGIGRRKPNPWQILETVNKAYAMWRLRLS